jgi:MFS transporter, DHA1 family, L-arabinose/isopropyl-beta-D-thiogalactopyranoside export protein
MGLGAWLPLLGITLSAFIFNTSEFMPIALLTDMAADLGVTESVAGIVITVYAWSVMVLSLPLMMFASRFPLKRVLLCVICVFLAGQAVTVLSGSYAMLVTGRVVVAAAHAVFWSIASPIAVRLVPQKFTSLALGMVVTGSSVATIVGMPLGRIVGLALGWRSAFLVVAAITAVVLVYLTCVFPKMPAGEPFTVAKLPVMLSNRALVGIYVFIAVLVTGYYTTYSYIEPFLLQVGGLEAGTVTAMLTVFGVAGIVGSFVYARFFDGHRARFFRAAVGALLVALLALGVAACSPVLVIADFLLWGVASTSFNVSFQGEVIRITSQDESAVATSIYSGIFNLGIGAGSALGGVVVSGLGVGSVGYAGAALVLVAFVFLNAWLLPQLTSAKTRE